MAIFWMLLAAVLLLVYSAQRKRLRRQSRELRNQTSRLDHFTAETLRLQRQSDRAADRMARRSDEAPPTD